MRRRSDLAATVLAFSCLLLAAAPAASQGESVPLTPEQVRVLLEVKYALATLDDLEQHGKIDHATAEAERELRRARARDVLGGATLIDRAMADAEGYLGPVKPAGPAGPGGPQGPGPPGAGPAQPADPTLRGIFTFVNIIWFIAASLLATALAWLFRLYLVPILRHVPQAVYEGLAYVGCAAFLVGGRAFEPDLAPYIALPGCLGLVGAFGFSGFRHKEGLEAFFRRLKLDPLSTAWFLLLLCWAPVALAYESAMLGFLAVGALLSWVGFSVMVLPLCYVIGFRKKEVIPRSMAAAFLLMAVTVPLRILALEPPVVAIFAPGALFLGTFVYYTGCLIVSTRFYWKREEASRYGAMQVLTILSGLAGLWLGTTCDIGALRGIGGTFFFLYLLGKYFELPWRRAQMAWAALGLALILYLAAWMLKRYPEYFVLLAG